ncbi:hypothetical protein HI914_02249 [Erysiphe necator]|uniref:Putative histone chaperone domain chz n=1 Tax=Uncinula necator TaxID=52586 RepID=A0A0B1P688_UNCNE|nr:hypothetical protein HI914_02249 [Erysiphe necator]KHJ32189.1 putative histone chaperone domain chz [Erysiphe necator]
MSEQSAKSEVTPEIQDGEKVANIPVEASAGATVETPVQDKGKGVLMESTHQDISMDDAESSSEDEAAEGGIDVVDPDEEDTMEEIDPQNIISGERRTRGRNIDFAKAAKELGPDDEDEDEEDEDFEIVEDEEMKE